MSRVQVISMLLSCFLHRLRRLPAYRVGNKQHNPKYTGIFKFGLQFYVQTRPIKRDNHSFEIFKTLKARDQFKLDRCLTGFRYTYPNRVLLLPFEQLIVT